MIVPRACHRLRPNDAVETKLTRILTLHLVIASVRQLIRSRKSNPQGLPFPPGPPSWPIIGNAFDMPKSKSWLTYTEWAKQYGDLVHVTVFGQHIVIINSLRVASDLLDKTIYSDRPFLPIMKLMEWDFALGFIPWGERWRRIRRMVHQNFRAEATATYHPIIAKYVHRALCGLLETPEDFAYHVRLIAASTVMHVTYGYEIKSKDDYYVRIAEEAIAMITSSTYPGTSAVNIFPVLQYLPGWLPGMGFKRFTNKSYTLATEMKDIPYELTKSRIAAGTCPPCMTSRLLQAEGITLDQYTEEEIVKPAAGVVYSAGADTTVAYLTSAILAMVLHPVAQKRAQEQIDLVVGRDRLPTFEDRESLPYIEAFLREVLRWRPATPLGLSHACMEDNIYNGYFVLKGAAVVTNIWAMFQDSRVYLEPTQFTPERHLSTDGHITGDYPDAAFGFGGRICPGQPTADAELWMLIANVLAIFELEPLGEIDSMDYTDGLASHSAPFRCRIIPRDATAEALVRATGD